MTQEELKCLLDKNFISYKQEGQWLIIDDKNTVVDLSGDNYHSCTNNILESLPEYLVFNNNGNVDLSYNSIKELPKNIYFGKNIKTLFLIRNDDLKINYFGKYFSKIPFLYTKLNDNLISLDCHYNNLDEYAL